MGEGRRAGQPDCSHLGRGQGEAGPGGAVRMEKSGTDLKVLWGVSWSLATNSLDKQEEGKKKSSQDFVMEPKQNTQSSNSSELAAWRKTNKAFWEQASIKLPVVW